ncbi:hypothetical protein NQ317_011613 [Molorchus minor]|uniref:Uncharacterized protein n=1 Tax=Molorchus minor TaxID=1323400 RepID=A0ABQ9J8X7_9CUCU|nr:hypothetical protein NQ317_011613 [Molorchus minor]
MDSVSDAPTDLSVGGSEINVDDKPLNLADHRFTDRLKPPSIPNDRQFAKCKLSFLKSLHSVPFFDVRIKSSTGVFAATLLAIWGTNTSTFVLWSAVSDKLFKICWAGGCPGSPFFERDVKPMVPCTVRCQAC